MTEDLWQAGCERLASRLPEQQFNTWIRPLPPAQVTSGGNNGVALAFVPQGEALPALRS